MSEDIEVIHMTGPNQVEPERTPPDIAAPARDEHGPLSRSRMRREAIMAGADPVPPDDTTTTPVTAEGSYDWWRAEVARRDEELERLREIEKVTTAPADDDEMPTDPAELREMWEFINRQARWQWHMAHRFGDQVERLRADVRAAYDERDEMWERKAAALQSAGRAEAELADIQEQRASWKIKHARSEDARRSAEAKLIEVAMVKVWTNEDGKRFVFADDLTPILPPTVTS